jgi:hypothetical protein
LERNNIIIYEVKKETRGEVYNSKYNTKIGLGQLSKI